MRLVGLAQQLYLNTCLVLSPEWKVERGKRTSYLVLSTESLVERL